MRAARTAVPRASSVGDGKISCSDGFGPFAGPGVWRGACACVREKRESKLGHNDMFRPLRRCPPPHGVTGPQPQYNPLAQPPAAPVPSIMPQQPHHAARDRRVAPARLPGRPARRGGLSRPAGGWGGLRGAVGLALAMVVSGSSHQGQNALREAARDVHATPRDPAHLPKGATHDQGGVLYEQVSSPETSREIAREWEV